MELDLPQVKWNVEGLKEFFDTHPVPDGLVVDESTKVIDGKKLTDSFFLTMKVNKGKAAFEGMYLDMVKIANLIK